MSKAQHRLVFDCNVFAQSMINKFSPAGRCYQMVKDGQSILFVSAFVLEEIFELHLKLPKRYGVTLEDCQAIVEDVRSFAQYIDKPNELYSHPIDPGDSAYVNLAIEANADLIVSRDKHLIGLNDQTKHWAKDFHERFSSLRIVTPDQYLAEYETNDETNQ